MLLKTCGIILLLLSNIVSATPAIDSRWQRSYTEEQAGNYIAARVSMEQIINDTPDNEFAHIRKGWLNYRLTYYNASIGDYSRAVELNPSSIDAVLGVTLPLIAQQRWREAAKVAGSVIAVSNWNYTAHLRLMICEEALKQWDKLAQHATAVSKHYPTDTTTWVYLARAEAWRGDIVAAKVAYSRVLERSPAHVEATAYLRSHP